MNILVISLAGIGDTLFATPLIHELRQNFPQARIDALVLWKGSKDVLEGNPHLTSVHQKNLITASKADALNFLWRLRGHKYDLSLNTHPQSKIHYRAVARIINARTRVSHVYDNPSPLDRLLVNRTLHQDYAKHAVENNLALLHFAGAKSLLPRHTYELFLSLDDAAWAASELAKINWSQKKILGIHVGSGGTKNLGLRRWPLNRYLELLKKLRQHHPEIGVLLFGGPEEEKDNQTILAETSREQVQVIKTANLRQAAALLKHCGCFLSVDTALMHVAAAMQVPHQFVIETPTWNKPIEPFNHPFSLIQNPAVAGRNLQFYRYDGRGIQGSAEELVRCMNSVTADAVYAALLKAL